MNKTLSNIEEKQLAMIASGDKNCYSERKDALDKIRSKNVLKDLSFNAKDEWIKLESATKCKNDKALLYLANESKDEGVRLEAALELKNENKLAEIALVCDELFYGSIAIGYISDPELLRKIITNNKYNRLKTEAAIKLGDINIIAGLARKITDDWFRYQLAASIGDVELLNELAKNSMNPKVRELANEWLDDLLKGI